MRELNTMAPMSAAAAPHRRASLRSRSIPVWAPRRWRQWSSRTQSARRVNLINPKAAIARLGVNLPAQW